MVYKKLKKNILANSFIDFPQTSVGEDLLRIERKADINTQEIAKTNANVANNLQAIEQINQELDTCAKLSEDNVFNGNNTFYNPIVVGEPIEDNNATTKSYVDTQLSTTIRTSTDNNFTGNNTFKQIKVKGTNNNQNYILLDNFDWERKNYSAIKLVKEGTKNLLQLEAINNDNSVAISAPSATSFTINNLSTPTQNNQAANKGYVDNVSLKKRSVNIAEFGVKSNFANQGMRFICKNKDLTPLGINYTQVVNVKWVNDGSPVEITFSWCVFLNNWIELKFLRTNNSTEPLLGGYVEIYYK